MKHRLLLLVAVTICSFGFTPRAQAQLFPVDFSAGFDLFGSSFLNADYYLACYGTLSADITDVPAGYGYIGGVAQGDYSWAPEGIPVDPGTDPSDIEINGTYLSSGPTTISYVGPMFGDIYRTYRCYTVTISYGLLGGSQVIYQNYRVAVGPE